MKIEINVDELQFKEILDGELKNLPQEKIHEVILECIREYFSKDNVIKSLFVESSWYREEPSYFLKRLVQEHTTDEDFKDIQQEILSNLKNNYPEILSRAITDVLLNGILGSSAFESAAREVIHRVSVERANPNSY